MPAWKTTGVLAAGSVLWAGIALAQGTQSAPPTAPGAAGTQTPSSQSQTPKAPAGAAETTKPATATPKSAKLQKSAKGMPSQNVKTVQEALKAKGHDPGQIDGVLGPKTSAALKEFQKSEGLPDTGRLDDKTRSKLGV